MKGLTAFDVAVMSSRTITDEGFLVAPGILARTGVQPYRARELGLDKMGFDGDKLIRLLRPAEEVFAPDSMASFNNKPITIGHPKGQLVTADNWEELAVGDVYGVEKKDQNMGAMLMVRSKKAVKAVQSGKTALSNGYTFDLDMTPGVTTDGQSYDGIQRNIRGNHVAIVDVARGGPACRIADSTATGEKKMRKVVVDGISVEVEDTAADLITKLMTDRQAAQDALATEKQKLVDATNAHATALVAKDAEIVAAKALIPTPEQVNAQVAERQKLVGDAQKLVPDFTAESKTNEQVKRESLTAVLAKDSGSFNAVATALLAGKTVADADATLIDTLFLAAVASVPTASTSAADEGIAAALLSDKEGGARTTDNKLVGRDAFVQRSQQAWQKR